MIDIDELEIDDELDRPDLIGYTPKLSSNKVPDKLLSQANDSYNEYEYYDYDIGLGDTTNTQNIWTDFYNAVVGGFQNWANTTIPSAINQIIGYQPPQPSQPSQQTVVYQTDTSEFKIPAWVYFIPVGLIGLLIFKKLLK